MITLLRKKARKHTSFTEKHQQIDIYYHGVDTIRLAAAEEIEELLQGYIANKNGIAVMVMP